MIRTHRPGLKRNTALAFNGTEKKTGFRTLAFLLSAALLLGGSACTRSSAENAVPARPAQFKTAVAQMRSVSQTLEIPARIQPDPARVVRVFPPAAGRLLRVTVRPGDQVTRGQVVAVLESSDVSQARSDLTKAEADFDRDKHSLERSKLLSDHKVLSEREYEDAVAKQVEAKSELERARARMRVLGASEKDGSNEVAVVSPLAGTVLDIGASSGELSKSTDNATPICTIANLNTVWITGDVYEKDLADVRTGVPVVVSVTAYPDRQWTGTISRIADAIDPQSRTVKVRVVLQNPRHELKPEMFASLRLNRPETKSLVIPASAVLHEGGDSTVMVQTSDSKHERRLITVRPFSNEEVLVTAGLKSGEIVVSEGVALLRGSGE